jgi:hypothetical protein
MFPSSGWDVLGGQAWHAPDLPDHFAVPPEVRPVKPAGPAAAVTVMPTPEEVESGRRDPHTSWMFPLCSCQLFSRFIAATVADFSLLFLLFDHCSKSLRRGMLGPVSPI